MDRRDFMKIAGLAGLTVVTPASLFGLTPGRAWAQSSEPGGPYWLFVHAGGGWDPTSLCDPKGAASEEEENPMNRYLAGDIGQAGNIRYAPVAWNREFFERNHQRTLVLNGVDTQTNSHDAGTRHTWSGKLGEGYPSLAALIAGLQARDRPMSFISNGGYDNSGGLVAPTRTGNIAAINRIAHPNALDGNPENGLFHTAATQARIAEAMEKRRAHLRRSFELPKAHAGIDQLFTARVGRNEVKRLSEYLPAEFHAGRIQRQSQVAMAAFKAGIGKTANLTIGGFDTHGNHDDNHYPRMAELMEGVSFAWEEAERQGVADDLIVMVSSDFGRTPGYNDGNGKDHWSITSVLLMGKGIRGNRVIGKTDERHRPIPLDPETLQPAADPEKGIRIEPKHIHRALRKLAGINDDPKANSLFPLLDADDLNLLG